jgi:Protein of unknown function (DUF3619)
MTTEDKEFANKLTAYLDRSAANLKAGTAYKLQLARQAALARLALPQRATAMRLTPALAGAGAGTNTAGGSPGFRTGFKLWLGILLIVAAGFGYQQWQAYQQLTDLEETDAAILASDLPIDAYLDRGFQNWLKSIAD